MEFDDEENVSIHIFIMSCSCKGVTPMTSLGSEESLSFVEVEKVLFLNLFFNVEFQKFLISLSVLPGRRAAI